MCPRWWACQMPDSCVSQYMFFTDLCLHVNIRFFLQIYACMRWKPSLVLASEKYVELVWSALIRDNSSALISDGLEHFT